MQREDNSQPCVLKANQEKKYDWKIYVSCVHAWSFHLLFLKTPQSSQTALYGLTMSNVTCKYISIYLGQKENVR